MHAGLINTSLRGFRLVSIGPLKRFYKLIMALILIYGVSLVLFLNFSLIPFYSSHIKERVTRRMKITLILCKKHLVRFLKTLLFLVREVGNSSIKTEFSYTKKVTLSSVSLRS